MQNGFFLEKELLISDCSKCGLYRNCISPKMESTGEGKKKILIVAEAPGKTEDEKGIQLIGEAGQVLRKALKEINIDLDKDCWKTNAICCRPPNNRTPTLKEINSCKSRLFRTIQEKKPNVIVLLGNIALDSYLYDTIGGKSGGINKWRGFVIPSKNSWIIPTYHPSFILRSKGNFMLEKIFKSDLKNILKVIDKPLTKNPEPIIDIQLDDYDTIEDLEIILEKETELIAFDYETTGLKSYDKGHEIICCAISYENNISFVFELTSRKVIRLWKEILRNENIKKTAHNMKFEHQWSKNILNTEVKGWEWDSMLASHIIDNRQGITGLKFQAYIYFGQEDYSSHIEKYLKGSGKFNRIKEAPKIELMKYCGMDAMIQYKLTLKQMEGLR